jgi:hypothetical protein
MPVPDANARLKILYHHRTASRDGQAMHIEEMVRALRGAGCEVIIVEPPSTGATRFGTESKLISGLRHLLPKVAGELLELGYNWLAYRRLKRAYLRHRPDVLYGSAAGRRRRLSAIPGRQTHSARCKKRGFAYEPKERFDDYVCL